MRGSAESVCLSPFSRGGCIDPDTFSAEHWATNFVEFCFFFFSFITFHYHWCMVLNFTLTTTRSDRTCRYIFFSHIIFPFFPKIMTRCRDPECPFQTENLMAVGLLFLWALAAQLWAGRWGRCYRQLRERPRKELRSLNATRSRDARWSSILLLALTSCTSHVLGLWSIKAFP